MSGAATRTTKMLPPEIKMLLDHGAEFWVSHSGGKDSQAMYSWICRVIPHDQIRVVHADLGEIEHVGTKDHIIANIYHPLHIAQAIHANGEPATFFSLVRRQAAKHRAEGREGVAPFPDSKNRFCTSDLKTGPVWKVIRRESQSRIVVNCVGIRAEESRRRAKKVANRGTLNINKKNTNGVREAYDWWPIADWTIDQVWQEIADAGQNPHAVYARNQRMSCVFCVFGSDNDIENGARMRPDLLSEYLALESETGYTMFNGQSLAERVGIIATDRNPRQFEMFETDAA